MNHHIDASHFRMHTISSVLSTVERGNYAFKIELQDAYFHVLIHPDSRNLRFAFENKVYQFRVLPFVLNTAPWVFTRLAHRVAAYLHHQAISVILYLEDWLIDHPDCQVLLRHQSQLLHTLNMVGLGFNKSVQIHGITQLGLRSHPTGSPVFEAPLTTFSFIRPDKPVYTTFQT